MAEYQSTWVYRTVNLTLLYWVSYSNLTFWETRSFAFCFVAFSHWALDEETAVPYSITSGWQIVFTFLGLGCSSWLSDEVTAERCWSHWSLASKHELAEIVPSSFNINQYQNQLCTFAEVSRLPLLKAPSNTSSNLSMAYFPLKGVTSTALRVWGQDYSPLGAFSRPHGRCVSELLSLYNMGISSCSLYWDSCVSAADKQTEEGW